MSDTTWGSTELTNEVIKDVLTEYESGYVIADYDGVMLDLCAKQDRPWLLVERNIIEEREVYLSLHRSLDSVEWAIAEAVWETSWRPVMVYNTKSGEQHEVAMNISIGV